jgi:hypothetical protein
MPVKGLKVGGQGRDGEADGCEPGKGISSYIVGAGLKCPRRQLDHGPRPRARLEGLKLGKGERLAVAVKAVDGRGIESWDWARLAAAVK